MKQVIRHYYGFQFFFGLLIWLPVFYEFQKRIGLNDQQIFSIQSIYYVVFCLLEIPTGSLADRFGYRTCLRAGAVLIAISNLLPIFVQNYAGFLSHFLLIALARSFISGASSAYLYDYLGAHKASDRYKAIEGRARAYSLAGKVVFWIGVGALMNWHLTAPYWATFLATGLSAIFAFLLPPLPASPNARAPSPQMPLVGAARQLVESPFLVFLILQGIAIFVLARIAQVNLFQPILGSKGIPLAQYGIVMALMTIFEACGSWVPHLVRRYCSDLNAVFFLTAVMATALGVIPFANPSITVMALSAFSLAAGLAFPIQRQLLNDSIPDSGYRATILSIESIADRAVNAVAAALLGSSLAAGGLEKYLLSAAGATMLAITFLYILRRRGGLQKQAASGASA